MALYCSQKLPAFLKEIDAYKRGDYEQALKDAFVSFDATLVNDDVIEELKKLIPEDKVDETDTDEEADEDEENIHELCNEGRMPLNELLEKLKDPLAKVKQGESSGTSKPLSPFLRGRRNGSSSGLGGSGSGGGGSSSSGGGSSGGSAGGGGSSAPAASENGECSSASDSTIKPKKLDVSSTLIHIVSMKRSNQFDWCVWRRDFSIHLLSFQNENQCSEEEAVSSSSASLDKKEEAPDK